MIVATKSGKSLSINGREIEFDQRVEDMVVLADRVLIELRVSDFAVGDPLVGRNILAYDAEGKLLWRIPANGLMRPSRFGGETPEAYFGLWFDESDNKLKTTIPSGWTLELDPETGEPFDPVFTK